MEQGTSRGRSQQQETGFALILGVGLRSGVQGEGWGKGSTTPVSGCYRLPDSPLGGSVSIADRYICVVDRR